MTYRRNRFQLTPQKKSATTLSNPAVQKLLLNGKALFCPTGKIQFSSKKYDSVLEKTGEFTYQVLRALWIPLRFVFSQKAVALSLVLLLVIIGSGFTVTSVFDASIKTVSLNMDGRQVFVETVASDVSGLLQQCGIEVAPTDDLFPDADSPLENNMEITIKSAICVTILDGVMSYKVMMQNGCVGDAIQLAGLQLDEDDTLSCDPNTMVRAGMCVEVARMTYETVEEYVHTPFKTVWKNTSTLYAGNTKVQSHGVDGEKIQKTVIVYKNGVKVDEYIAGDTVQQQTQDEVILVGTLPSPTPTAAPTPKPTAKPTAKPSTSSAKKTTAPAATSKPPKTLTASSYPTPSRTDNMQKDGNTITVDGVTMEYTVAYSGKATAYTHTGNRTATGTWPKVGTVAVDPKYIPLGSRLYIPSYGFCKAEDTGDSVIKGYTVDLFMETEEECRQWGVCNITIYILK